MSEIPFQGRLNYSAGDGLSSLDSGVQKTFRSSRGNITPSLDYSFQKKESVDGDVVVDDNNRQIGFAVEGELYLNPDDPESEDKIRGAFDLENFRNNRSITFPEGEMVRTKNGTLKRFNLGADFGRVSLDVNHQEGTGRKPRTTGLGKIKVGKHGIFRVGYSGDEPNYSLRFDIPLGGAQAKAEGGEVMNRMEQGIASIPRQTVIRDQPHMLAYITPAEAMLLKQNGGSGLPSHGGVPEFGLWSSTFGGGNSFEQSMQNTFGGEDGGSYKGGEWQGNDGYSTGSGVYQTSEPAGIPNPEQSSRNAAARNAAIPNIDPLDKEDDKPQPVQFAQPMYQAPMPASFAPPTLDPISSGQPPPPFSDLLNPTIVDPELPNNPMPVGPNMPIGQRPANKAYTFQELLGMYQNPYA